MLKLKPKFDLHRDVVSDILRKEASVCRVKGEAFRCRRQQIHPTVYRPKSSSLSVCEEP